MSASLITQRVLHGTTDVSVAVGDYRVGSYAITYTAGQYLYVGTCCPFNNLWFDLSTVASSSAGTPTIKVWYNQAWADVVDIVDQTSGMTESGRISWALEYYGGWCVEQLSTTVGLTGTAIYNRYWMRINWPSSYTAKIGYIGQKFSTDDTMNTIYPDLMRPEIINGFKQGKTDWDRQHFMASESIIRDLRKRNVISFGQQLLDWSVFDEASAHKVAEIVYYAFGAPYATNVLDSQKRYQKEMDSKHFVVDTNMDGHAQPEKLVRPTGYMTR